MNTPTKSKCGQTPTKAKCDRTPTPRTKEIWGAMLYTYPFLINCVNETGEMEAELTAAREELAEWSILKGWGGTPEIINDFIKGQQTRIHYAQNIEEELTAVTEQRDRLANALDNLVNANQKWNETMMGIIGRPPNWNDSYLNEAKEALQSLNKPE